MQKGSILLFLFFIFNLSFNTQAKEFAVGFSPENFKKIDFNNQKNLFMPGVVTKKVLKNLDLVIVEGSNEAVDLLGKNPLVSFTDELRTFKAPQKRFSLPFETFVQKSLVNYPWGILDVDAPSVWEQTQAGKGVKVLVLDSGIDQDHPNIASRLVEARDFLNSSGEDLPYPHFDSLGHGTHVAGTILADGLGTGVIGVAPSASLYVGKVCDEGCPGSAILAGIDWAIEDKMDVVNMSLGGAFSSSTAERAYQRAEDANVVVIAASGNDGRGSVSFPSGYLSVLSVGAIDESHNIATFSNWGRNLDVVAPGVDVLSSLPRGTGREANLSLTNTDSSKSLETFFIDGTTIGSVADLSLVYVGLGTAADYENLDLSGKVALVSRGEISFGDKAKGAIAAGADAIVIFNNVPNEALRATFGEPLEIIGLTLDQETGQEIVTALSSEESRNLTISADVSATDFDFLNGTSMATPHVSGIAALVRAANPSLNASEVKDVIRNSAIPTMNDNSENKYGHGMANAYKAVNTAKSFLP